MRGPKRTKVAILEDRAKVMRLLRRGYTQTQIAEKLGVCQSQVSYDYRKVVKQLMEQQDEDTRAIVAVKLAELAEVKREAWRAWERSKKDSQRKVEQRQSSEAKSPENIQANQPQASSELQPVKVTETTQGRLPANEYLVTILDCWEKECKLRALYPENDKAPPVSATINWDVLIQSVNVASGAEALERKIAEAAIPNGFKEL